MAIFFGFGLLHEMFCIFFSLQHNLIITGKYLLTPFHKNNYLTNCYTLSTINFLDSLHIPSGVYPEGDNEEKESLWRETFTQNLRYASQRVALVISN